MREPSISSPVAKIERFGLGKILAVTGAVGVVLGVALFVIDEQLRSTGGPGILALEVAGTPGRASVILAEWGPDGIDWARISLLVDFPFLLAYGLFLAALATAAGNRIRPVAAGTGPAARLGQTLVVLSPWIAWGFIAAAGSDVIENIALLRVIEYDLTPWARLAEVAAAVKFGLLGGGVGYLIGVAILALFSRRR